MRAYRHFSQSLILAVIVTVDLLWLDLGASAQVNTSRATPALIEEVDRLVSRHFYDRSAVERVWAKARATHSAALPADPSNDQVAAALDAMLAEFGVSHTGHYTPGELAYYELLDIFARDNWAPRLRKVFPNGDVTYTGIGVVPRTLEGRVFLAGVYHGGPAARAGLRVGDEIIAAEGRPFDPIASFAGKAGQSVTLAWISQTGRCIGALDRR